jgi:hypothetical protein
MAVWRWDGGEGHLSGWNSGCMRAVWERVKFMKVKTTTEGKGVEVDEGGGKGGGGEKK